MAPPYPVEYTDEVTQFLQGLNQEVRKAVLHYVKLIANRQILPDRVRSTEHPTYKIKIPPGETPGWPGGLRIMFRVSSANAFILIVDVGDHATCASRPGHARPTNARVSSDNVSYPNGCRVRSGQYTYWRYQPVSVGRLKSGRMQFAPT